MEDSRRSTGTVDGNKKELLDVNCLPDDTDDTHVTDTHSDYSNNYFFQPDNLPTNDRITDNDEDKLSNTGSIYGLPVGDVSTYRAVFLISNAALGAGLMNFPEAYMRCGGIHNALSIQVVLLVFIIGAFIILAHCANQFQTATYQDIILFTLGKRFYNFSQVCILVYFFGAAITYVIIIGEQLSSVLELFTGHTGTWYTNKKILFVIFSVVFLLPLCLPRRLKALSYTSLFSGLGAFFITGVIVHNYFSDRYKDIPQHPKVATDWKSAFAALPVICFGFQCHVSSVAVYAELKNRSASKFFWCAFAAMMVCAVTYSLCGSFGYATFGQATKPDILTNYADNDTPVNVARVAMLLNILSSFAIVTFCGRIIIEGVVVKLRKYDVYAAERTERRRRVLITFLWFLCVLLLALIVPNIRVAIDMISGVASLFIFTFPGLMLLNTINLQQDVLKIKDIALLVVAGAYLVLGSFIFGLVTTLAIRQDITMKQLH